MDELKDIPRKLYLKAEYCGSRITCWPTPLNTDLDILVLVADDMMHLELSHVLDLQGYEVGGSIPNKETAIINPEYCFASHTKDVVNLIITSSSIFYDRFMLATHLCKNLNEMDKRKRIAIFQAILYQNIVSP